MRVMFVHPRAWIPLGMALLIGAWGLSPGTAYAADNTATGDIAGVGADLTDSNIFTG